MKKSASTGFLDAERKWLDDILGQTEGIKPLFIDGLRKFNPDKAYLYSW